MPTATIHDRRAILQESHRRKQRRCFEAFFRAHEPTSGIEPYTYGKHTTAIIRELDLATKRFAQGKSTYVIINVMQRHGKSDIASRRFPVWFLGNNPDREIILASYNDALATGMSRDARTCFREVAPDLWGLSVSDESSAVSRWHVQEHHGCLYATGLGGTITGRGAHALIIDDYLKGREEAESRTIRDKTWDSFTHDLLSRLAPTGHFVIIVATRWHEDDLVGRIIRKNTPTAPEYDPKFPTFKIVRFPAQDDEGNWLFPERVEVSWYESQKAQLGTYGWNSLGQQNPQPRIGNLLHAERRVILPDDEFFRVAEAAGARFQWGWDLASTAKEVARADPDYSAGVLAAYSNKGGSGKLFVCDMEMGQWRGTTRNERIRKAAERWVDRSQVVYVECIAGYLDAYDEVRTQLAGRFAVRKFVPVHDKVARASVLEPVMETGDVYVRQGTWNAAWEEQMIAFPGGTHDDVVDGTVTSVHNQVRNRGMSISR